MFGRTEVKTVYGGSCHGHHFGTSLYNVSEEQMKAVGLDSIVPFYKTDEQLIEIYRAVARKMNVLWSSSHGVPNFPERYNGKQKIFIHDGLIHFIGEGWAMFYYSGDPAGWRAMHTVKVNEAIKNRDTSFFQNDRRVILVSE